MFAAEIGAAARYALSLEADCLIHATGAQIVRKQADDQAMDISHLEGMGNDGGEQASSLTPGPD